MVARAVSNRIQQMSNRGSNGVGYDVATVVLIAKPDRVYQYALNALKTKHPDITVTSTDDKKHEIKFAKGDQVASMQATALGKGIDPAGGRLQRERRATGRNPAGGPGRDEGL